MHSRTCAQEWGVHNEHLFLLDGWISALFRSLASAFRRITFSFARSLAKLRVCFTVEKQEPRNLERASTPQLEQAPYPGRFPPSFPGSGDDGHKLHSSPTAAVIGRRFAAVALSCALLRTLEGNTLWACSLRHCPEVPNGWMGGMLTAGLSYTVAWACACGACILELPRVHSP